MGDIISLGEPVSATSQAGREYQYRDVTFDFTDNPDYPCEPTLRFFGRSVAALYGFQEGERVEVRCSLRVSQVGERTFVNVQPFGIYRQQAQPQTSAPPAYPAAQRRMPANPSDIALIPPEEFENENDLPF